MTTKFHAYPTNSDANFESSRIKRYKQLWIVVIIFMLLGLTGKQTNAMPLHQSPGDFNLLNVLNKLSSRDVQQAMSHFPVPFAVLTRSSNPNAPGGFVETVNVFKSGSPKRIDVDGNNSTGRGGKDIDVKVEQLLGPPFQLQLTINRLTPPSGNIAPDLTVVVAFPTDAFNDEILDAPPYLFLGYTTRENEPGQTAFIPQIEQIVFTPNVIGGTIHDIQLTLNSSDTPDSVQYLSGFYQNEIALDPPPPGASLLDLASSSLRLTPVPTTATLSLDTSEIFTPTPSLSEIALSWTASDLTTAELTFEDNIGSSDMPTETYQNVITIDQMPTQETITATLDLGNAPPMFTLAQDGNSDIDAVAIDRQQTNGNANQTCTFTDVPQQTNWVLQANSLTASFGPPDNVQNSPALGSAICDFSDDGGLLNSDFKRAQSQMLTVPDVNMNWNTFNAAPTISANTINAGDYVGFVGVSMATGDVFPEIWDPNPSSHPGEGDMDHVFAFEDDADGFRFAAGFAQLVEATYNFNSNNISTAYDIELFNPNHLTLELFIDKDNATVLNSDKNVDIKCEIHDVPRLMNLTDTNYMDRWNYTASDRIDSVTCSGKIGTKDFVLTIGDLPTMMSIDYQGGDHLNLTVPVGDKLGLFDLFCHDPNGLDGTEVLFGKELRYAQARIEDAPTMAATWANNAASFDYNFVTPNMGETLGLVKLLGAVNDIGTPPGATNNKHFAYLIDEGANGEQEFGVQFHKLDTANLSKSSAGNLNFDFNGTQGRPLHVSWQTSLDSQLTGPDKGINAKLNIIDLPGTINFFSNFSTKFNYDANSTISTINSSADIKLANGAVEETHIDTLLTELPAHIALNIVPVSVVGSVSFDSSSTTGLLRVEMTSQTSILNEDYRHIFLELEDIPADWDAKWGITPNEHISFSTADNQPLGSVSLILSKDDAASTDMKYESFTSAGGKIQYTDFAREVDRRYFRLGDGDDEQREEVFMKKLDGLDGNGGIYGTTTKLDKDENEDHIIILERITNNGSEIHFVSIYSTQVQCLSWQKGPGSEQCVEDEDDPIIEDEINFSFLIPDQSVHPFYVGIQESSGKFLTVQIEDVPDTTRAVLNPEGRANIDLSSSPGEITVFYGPLPMANDGNEALKIIMRNTPSFVHLNWSLGLPGEIEMDTSNTFEILFLAQDSNDRMVFNLFAEDMTLQWNLETSDSEIPRCIEAGPIPIPIMCSVFIDFIKASMNFEAAPAIDGFMSAYENITNVELLTPPGPAPGATEYVPVFSALVKDFGRLKAEVGITMCVIPTPVPLPPHPDCLGPFIPKPFGNAHLNGLINLDWWDQGGGPFNMFQEPDYTDNDPWHLFEPFHSHGGHLFPYD